MSVVALLAWRPRYTPGVRWAGSPPASGVARVGAMFAAAMATVVAGLVLLAGDVAVAPVASGPQPGPEVGGEVPVTAMHQARGVANNSPVLAADPTARQFLAAAHRRDAPRFGCGLAVSGSGGQGWRPVNPVSQLPERAKTCYAPEVSFGPGGRLHYLFTGLHGQGNEPLGVFLSSSDDRGQNFTEPQQVLGERNFSARLAVDRGRGERGRMYLTWLHATSDPPLGAMPPPPNPIKFAASADGGQKWSNAVRVNPTEHQRVAAPTLRVAPDGTIYVAYYDLKDDKRDYKGLGGPVYDGRWSLVLARSTDGGETFTATVVEDAVRPVERVMLIFTMAPPALAAGPDGRVCVAWPQAHEGHGDILGGCSSDQGESWTEPTRLNRDPGDSSAIHVLPQLAFAPNGRLDAAFLARNPTSDMQHAYYTVSHDGGQSFDEAVRVTSQPSSTRMGQRYVGPAAEDQVEFGSRLGLLARDDHAVMMWPDTRNSRVRTKGQDLFAARLTHPNRDTSGGPAAALVGGGLLAVGLLAGGVGLARRRLAAAGPDDSADVAGASGYPASDTELSEDGQAAAAGQGDGTASGTESAEQRDTQEESGLRAPRPRWPRRVGLGLATLAAVGMAAGLGWGPVSQPPPQLPSDPPRVTVTIDEDGLSVDKPVPSGRVVVRVANRGEEEHRLALLPMGEDEPSVAEQLADDAAQVTRPLAGVSPLKTGESTAFAVDLRPDGRYMLADFSDAPQGGSYADQGWHDEFRTTSAPPEASSGNSPAPQRPEPHPESSSGP